MRYILLFTLLLPCAVPHTGHAGGLEAAMAQAAAGLQAQSVRINVAAQNIANAESTALVPGGEPYRRKEIFFEERYDPALGGYVVGVSRISRDYATPFKARYDPSHPAANAEGYVLYPNVDSAVENADIREAERSYEANVTALETARTMYTRTIDMLR